MSIRLIIAGGGGIVSRTEEATSVISIQAIFGLNLHKWWKNTCKDFCPSVNW